MTRPKTTQLFGKASVVTESEQSVASLSPGHRGAPYSPHPRNNVCSVHLQQMNPDNNMAACAITETSENEAK